MVDVSSCGRCGAAPFVAADDHGCATCGALPALSTAEALRQERALAWTLRQVLADDDTAAAAAAALERSASRTRLLAETAAALSTVAAPSPVSGDTITDEVADKVEADPTPGTTTASDGAEAPAPPITTAPMTPPEAPSTTSSDADATTAPAGAPTPLSGVGIGAPIPARPRPAPRRPEPPPPPRLLSPAEARAQFERRLEIGGWFTGALFAVGGSLWATNLFWSDIPAALRPVVVGGGLAAFAAAFMAVGAVLATRHAQSLAGPVLGLVGRLIGVSATIPLAMLRQEALPLWFGTTALVVAALLGGLRFAHRRRTPDVPTGDAFDASPFFIAGFVLAAMGPTSTAVAIPVAIAALLVARAAVAAGTLPAIAGQRTWVDDVSVVGVGVGGALAALFHAREDLGVNTIYPEAWSLALVAGAELVARLVEQRPGLYGLRPLTRWVFALWSIGSAAAVVDDNAAPTLAAGALLFVTAAFRDASRLSLPRFFSLIGTIAAAWSVAFLARLLPVSGDIGDAVATVTALATLWLLTAWHRRGAPDRGERVASFFVWCGAVGVAVAVDDDLGRVVATTVAALLFVTDRRLERSVPFGLVTVPVTLVPVALALAELLPSRLVAATSVGVLAIAAVVLHACRVAWPTRPLLPATTAAVWWTALAGVVTAFAATDHTPALVALAVCALALLIVQERSRQADPGVVGAALAAVAVAVVVGESAGWSSLRPGLALAALGLAVASFLPMSRRAHVTALARGWFRLGRSRQTRPFSIGLVAVVLVAILLVLRVPLIPSEGEPHSHLMVGALVVAALVLVWRAATTGRIAVLCGAAAVLGADIAVVVVDTVPLAAMGFGAGLVALVVAAIAIVVRRRDLMTAVLQRGQRRRRQGRPAVDTVRTAAAMTMVIADAVALVGLVDVSGADRGLWLLALWLTLVAAQSLVLFASLPAGGLVGLAVLSLTAAPLVLALRALLAGDEPATLGGTLGAVAVIALALLLARVLYRRRPLPSLLLAWPVPSALRGPALVMLVGLAGVIALFGVALQLDDATSTATRYGPGIVIVGLALAGAAVLAWRTRRSFEVAVVGGGVVGAVGVGLDGVAHAAHWVPKSFGDSQAMVALGLVVAALVLDRAAGRAALWRVGLGWPRPARARLVGLLSAAVPLLALLAGLLAVREAPRAHELAILGGGLALLALGLGVPTPTTARGAGIGMVVMGSGLGALVARLTFGSALALHEAALPTVALGGMLGAVALQALAKPLWRSGMMQRLHAGRHADDDTFLYRCGAAMRGAGEGMGLLLLAVIVAVAVADDRGAPLALWSTWFALGLAIWLTSRKAIESEQTWPAALGQGMALALYVDIRRRTPWLDDVAGIDVMACLAGAAVFMLVGQASRRQPKGASTARAAEVYAVTLPVIAAGLGDSDAGRAVICLIGGGLYAILSRTRRKPGYELAAGVALVAATTLALSAQGVHDATLYLLPFAFVGTFLARRHRARLGTLGRSLAVWCHVPLYCASAWSALQTGSFSAFALGVVITTGGVIYSMRSKDRRSLYAAAAAAAVLVIGRLVLLGLENALLGTLLLAGAGILLLAGMTVFTIRRDAASDAVKRATAGLDDWD